VMLLPMALWVAVAFWKRALFRIQPVLWLFLVWIFLYLITPLWFIPRGGFLFKSTEGYCLFTACFLQVLVDQLTSARWRKALPVCFLIFFVLLPLPLNSFGTLLMAHEGDQIHLDLDRTLSRIQEANPDSSTLFLLNAPNPVSVYLASVVYRFYHPEQETLVYTLGNAPAPPRIRDVEKKAFCLYNPEGLLVLNVPFPKIPLQDGQETPMPGFRATQKEVRDGIPREVCFSFDKPLNHPDYLFVSFEDGVPRKVNPGDI